MTRINDSQQLNEYYNTVTSEAGKKKSEKTRLIVVTDKSGTHLEARTLSLTERIGALFGGKASLKTVAEFCTEKGFNSEGFSKLVQKYNKTHSKSPAFYAHFIGGANVTKMPLVEQRGYFNAALEPAKHGNFKQLEALFKSHPKLLADPIVSTTLQSELRNAVQNNDEIKTEVFLRYVDTTGLLHSACSSGDLAMVRALHKTGADLNAPDETKMTPLMHAASKGQTEVVQFLLSNGVNPNQKTYLGTALQLASANSHANVVGLLLNDQKLDLKNSDVDTLQNALMTLKGRYENLDTDRLKAINIILLPHLSDLTESRLHQLTADFKKEDFVAAVDGFNAEYERLQASGVVGVPLAKFAEKATMFMKEASKVVPSNELKLNPMLLPRKL